MKERKIKKISAGNYQYRGYEIHNCGYHHPDHCVWWEACEINSDNASFHATTKRRIIEMIDEDFERERTRT